MEQVHGVDVSWMTQGSPKDRISRKPPSPPTKTPGPAQPQQPANTPLTKPTSANSNAAHPQPSNGHTIPVPVQSNGSHTPATRRRSRSSSIDRSPGPNGTPPSRRNSWFSNISAKLSGHPDKDAAPVTQEPPKELPEENTEDDAMPLPPPNLHYSSSPRGAVLPPGSRPVGNAPYTPAPPKSGQAGFLGVFRRLSSSGGNNHASRLGHGLVDRKVLNVDGNRERCAISELKSANLRKVSFCVDVEIAPMPKYVDGEIHERSEKLPVDSIQKKMTEKGEGEALKKARNFDEKEEASETSPSPPAPTPPRTEPKRTGTVEPAASDNKDGAAGKTPLAVATVTETRETKEANGDDTTHPDNTKKKEKKKRSEEERKARKEKKRRLAEANGSIPLEIHYDSSDSASESPDSAPAAPKRTTFPTTDPVRVYRRCCQLRETPILKKITEQLLDPTNSSAATGVVNKLDLTGYWLQHADIVTLGDYLAVVPVREVLLENSNLNDEGLRVVLAGLLASRRPTPRNRKPKHDREPQGGIVERLVVKNNKLGPDGWKHLSLFIYLCRSLKFLDVSNIPFPRQAAVSQANGTLPNGRHVPRGIAEVFSKALSDRLAGSALELLNIGGTEPTMDQLGTIVDGIVNCGVKRLGIAHNHLDEEGVGHLSRFVASGKCEGLDLSGNDLRDCMDPVISAVKETESLWALSLSDCNLKTTSVCKLLSALTKLPDFRFIDLSHNHDLFQTSPSAVGPLRRYLPKMEPLKRIHLQDVGMTAEQAIALVEIVPEIGSLAHINILGNSELAKLADATTEEDQEEACALYASLMAAARLSKSLVCVDIEVPSERSGELVKAMAKQVVAYCLRNMEDSEIQAAVVSAMREGQAVDKDSKPPAYPDVLAHIVGHDALDLEEPPDLGDDGPDEDYVIGGTGVVKALACFLKNRGDDSGRQSGEFSRDFEDENLATPPRAPTAGKARDTSKHLLVGARKIRARLQPALNKAKTNPADESNLRKLIFLDDTLQGIIKRFEDEYPDTREENASAETQKPTTPTQDRAVEMPGSLPAEDMAAGSDGEDESRIHPASAASRSSSVMSRRLAEEEGRILRAGHRFRYGFFTQEDMAMLASIDDIGSDPKHVNMLTSMAEDIGGELLELVKEKGAVRTFKENHEQVLQWMKEADPEYWERFLEAQHKARANRSVSTDGGKEGEPRRVDESAISD